MDKIKQLAVFYHERKVGTLALYQNRIAAFEYTNEWLADGFSISPFSLPLEKKVFLPKIEPFDGLHGVFADSLPDGWGRLLVDRLMLKNHLNPHEMGCLDRLAIVGDSGMGALTYKPEITLKNSDTDLSLDEIAEECGIVMEETRLFSSEKCHGYFGTKRFDRVYNSNKQQTQNSEGHPYTQEERVHMISASALLETSHRIPNLDYELLMRLTLQLTNDLFECEKLFRLMCFNVFAHNRDDHSKNFSYLYLENEERWILSPAYDLTYSNSIGGEHATTVHGNGRNPGINDILSVAKNIGIKPTRARQIAVQIQECVEERLGQYL